jgi:hypothetical protein
VFNNPLFGIVKPAAVTGNAENAFAVVPFSNWNSVSTYWVLPA